MPRAARNEVSGTRLWGWARDRFGKADAFFERFFVVNYCPLCFMEDSGRNRTPDKLPAAEREPLFAACDEALRDIIAHCQSPDAGGYTASDVQEFGWDEGDLGDILAEIERRT